MPSQKRENERKEKKLKNEQKTKTVIWIVLLVIVLALVIMKLCEVDFKSIKDRFFDENGNFTFSMTTDKDAYPFSMSSSGDVHIQPIGNKLGILNDTTCSVVNPSDAKVLYSFTHGYANPVIKYAGDYYCLIDQGAMRLRLDSTAENIFETKTDKPIICADVSKNGNIAYISRSNDGKTTLTVINKNLRNLLNYEIKSGYAVAVAIDTSGKRIAYACVDSKNAANVTTVYTIDTNDSEPRGSFEMGSSVLMDLHYSTASELYYISTNSLSVIRNQKSLNEVFKNGEVNTVCFNYTSDNELIYVYSKYNSSSDNKLVYVNSSGKVRTEIDLKQKPKYVCASNDICVLFADKVVSYSKSKGEVKETFKCDDSVTSVNEISTKIFISRNKVVDVLN